MKIDEIGIFEAKAGLSELVRKVLKGQRFFITLRGKRVAELRPVPTEKKPLVRGCARKETYFMSDDFDGPTSDFEEYM